MTTSEPGALTSGEKAAAQWLAAGLGRPVQIAEAEIRSRRKASE